MRRTLIRGSVSLIKEQVHSWAAELCRLWRCRGGGVTWSQETTLKKWLATATMIQVYNFMACALSKVHAAAEILGACFSIVKLRVSRMSETRERRM
jgi:hypothetical protein